MNTLRIKIGILLVIILVTVGCSQDENWQSPVSSAPSESVVTPQTVEFEGMLINLPEGWEPVLIPQPEDRLDSPRDRSGREMNEESAGDIPVNSWVCTTVRAQRDIFLNQVHYNWTGCWIPGSVLPRNRMDIEVCVDTLQAICEFGPHGTNFSGNIAIRIDFQYLGLDRMDIDLERDIAIFYVQDSGDLLEMPHWVDWTGHALVGSTNHFSRYIITRRVSA